MNYIKVEAIQSKLKAASRNNQILYICGSVGMGKTAAVEYYFRRKPHVIFSGREGYLPEMPPYDEIKEEILIFDDLSQITDTVSQDYIFDAIQKSGKQIVLIGRGTIPEWLSVVSIEKSFEIADNHDLRMTNENIVELFAEREIELSPESDDFLSIIEESGRNTLMLIYICRYMSKTVPFSETVVMQAERSLHQYMDEIFFERLNRELQNVLLSLCQLDRFNVSLAETITANPRVRANFEEMLAAGDFLIHRDEDVYEIDPFYRNYLQWKQHVFFTKQQRDENYERAAIYYELQDDIIMALECYRHTENYEKLTHLLYKIAEEHPGMENFRDVREYFDLIPMATIGAIPVLMSAMSMMYSLEMNPDQSEMWYKRLEEYAERAKRGSATQKEAKSRLLFLDITLPHRGTENLVDCLSRIHDTTKSWTGHYYPFSIIDSTPSIINGGLDLSGLIAKSGVDEEALATLSDSMETLLGKNSIGYVELALAEYHFERNEIQGIDMNEVLNQIYLDADAFGTIEVCYVAIALLIRECIAQGNFAAGETLYESFKRKVEARKADFLKPGIDTFHMWMSMVRGDVKEAGDWLPSAPDSTVGFTILDRYYYINKARVLILMQKNDQALTLIERMLKSCETYKRDYFWIQAKILKSILLYRLNEPRWESELEEALTKAQVYGYLRVAADEGAALKPLLDNFKSEKVDADYLKSLVQLTSQMAMYYPNYMKQIEQLEEPLTEMEQKVVRLMCFELSSEEICNTLAISYSGLKFHRQNIYRKFGVNNRQEAQRVAKSLGLNLQQI